MKKSPWTRAVGGLVFLLAICSGVPLVGQDAEPEKPFQDARLKGQSREAAATLVVYNRAEPRAEELARYYAQKRQIADDHLLGLDCPTAEEISRGDYDRTIAAPLRLAFDLRGWWRLNASGANIAVEENSIRFIALIRGIPLKIAATANYEGDRPTGPPPINTRNEAAVDSELALLGFHTRSITGALNNGYYRSFTRMLDAPPALMLVCRLDAPSGDTVRRMIDDSVEAEQRGLWGFAYIDSRNLTEGGLAEGDKWLLATAADARTQGIPVIHDSGPELFGDTYPMKNAAFYYGWYAEHVVGPFLRDDFAFTKGAIAVHIHSFSASTVRDPTKNWVAPLISRGAAATIGNVYEPYLALTPNIDIFHERLRAGFNFAESAYMSMRVLSWMTTFVGDPLYRPFKVVDDGVRNDSKTAGEFRAYRSGAQAWFKDNRAAGENRLIQSGRQLRSGIIFESLASLQASAKDPAAALVSFRQAREFYRNPEDILRVSIREAGLLKTVGKKGEALGLIRRQLQTYSTSPSAPLLRTLEAQLAAAG